MLCLFLSILYSSSFLFFFSSLSLSFSGCPFVRCVYVAFERCFGDAHTATTPKATSAFLMTTLGGHGGEESC